MEYSIFRQNLPLNQLYGWNYPQQERSTAGDVVTGWGLRYIAEEVQKEILKAVRAISLPT